VWEAQAPHRGHHPMWSDGCRGANSRLFDRLIVRREIVSDVLSTTKCSTTFSRDLPFDSADADMTGPSAPARTRRVALVSDSTAGFARLLDDARWRSQHDVVFPLIVQISAQPVSQRLRRIGAQTVRQARINRTSVVHQVLSAAAYRFWLQPSSADGHLNSVPGASIVEVASVNDDRTIAAIRRERIDAVVLLSADLLTANTLEAIGVPVYNVHDGDPRHVRGRPPFLWDIIDGRHETLVVLHEVEPAVDSGAMIHSQTTPIRWSSGLRQTLRECESTAVLVRTEVLRDGLSRLLAGDAPRTTYAPGPLRTLPTFGHIYAAARRCRQVSRATLVRNERAAEADRPY